jgi:hypothetical protein
MRIGFYIVRCFAIENKYVVPAPEKRKEIEQAFLWSNLDFAFATRELRQQYPTQPANLITATIQTAARITPPESGRVRLVKVAREVLREN